MAKRPENLVQYICPRHGSVDNEPSKPWCPTCNLYLGRPSHMETLGVDPSVRRQEAFNAPKLPAPQSAIERLQDLEITQDMLESQNKCVICTEDFELGETVKFLECGHFFHDSCIVTWLKEHRNQCPVCRATLFIPRKIPTPWDTDRRDRGSSSGSSSRA